MGIGAELYALLRRRFRPVDHVAVVRGSRKLEQPVFHGAAAEENFFLRSFNHLLVLKKERRRAAGDGPLASRPARPRTSSASSRRTS